MKTIITAIIITMVLFLFSGSIAYSYSYSFCVPPDSLTASDSLRIADSILRLGDSLVLNQQTILYIGKLNFDRFPDTLIGKQWQPFSFMPRAIRWGKKNDTLTTEIDTAHYVPDSLKVTESEFSYPVWKDMRGSITIDNINRDTVEDLLFVLSGISFDTVNPPHYKRMLAVFGQDYLDTMSVIDLSGIDSFQFHPFIALNLQPGQQLISPGHRDVSKGTSYIFPRINLPVRDSNESDSSSMNGNPGSIVASVSEKNFPLRVFPNPAAYFITVEGLKLPEGTYYVEITNSAGILVNKQEVQVTNNGELLKRLDLHFISTGYYLLKVHTGQKLLGVYQILIIH